MIHVEVVDRAVVSAAMVAGLRSARLDQVATLGRRRARLLAQLEEVTGDLAVAALAACDVASLTDVAAAARVSRQTLHKWRREKR